MQNKYLDDFLSNICGFKCFIIISKKQIKKFINIKSKFLLILRSNEKLNLSEISDFKVNVKSKLIQFKKKIKVEKKIKFRCRAAKVKDIPKLEKICRENLFGSRFEMDINLEKNFLRKYRSLWVKNYFLKKRGDYLFVAYNRKEILGFVLLIKEKTNLRIDQILVANRFKRLGIAETLLNYTCNKFSNNFKFIRAGTYDHNLIAKKMYKKMNFKREKIYKYIYHLYPKNYN